jgi:hypothetical protein
MWSFSEELEGRRTLMLLTDENSFDLDAVSEGLYRGEPFGAQTQVMSKHTHTHAYVVCPKSNESDFFAQRRRARKGKWRSRQVKGEPRYTDGPSSVESAPL